MEGEWTAAMENGEQVVAWMPIDERIAYTIVARFTSSRDAQIARDVLQGLDAKPPA